MTAAVNPAMARVLVEQALDKNYPSGVLGFRAPVAGVEAAVFDHGDQEVRLSPCVSALAAREAILNRPEKGWLVLVTDRSDEELGPGLLAQLVGQRLRRPDAWQAVQQRFGARAMDAVMATQSREVATGLLNATPPRGWPPAPAGVLSAGHAFGAVARKYLSFPEGPVDAVSIMDWTMRRDVSSSIADVRAQAGDQLVDAVLRWLADEAGPIGPYLRHLVGAGTLSDAVPLGLVLDALEGTPGTQAELAKARLQHRWAGVPVHALQAAGPIAAAVVADRLDDRQRQADAHSAMSRADALAAEAEAEPLMAASPLLRSGLIQRVRHLAAAMKDGAAAEVENAWEAVRTHRSATDAELRPTHAAVRLLRWLATDQPDPRGLAALSHRQADVDAWVDQAINSASTGVDEPTLARAIERVLERVKAVRDEHDRAFAAALARHEATPSGSGRQLYVVEQLIADVVAPVAKKKPALLLVLDGLSTGVATHLVQDLISRDLGMVEALLPKHSARAAALAALPTVTEYSRTSLLTGTLMRGDQAVEARRHPELTNALGLGRAKLFHKKHLDSSRPGHVVADEVRAAIMDTTTNRLVTCVLNTIDDALDRSDPGGTSWDGPAVKHLIPLLRAARDAGRPVIITSDHGHIVERRRGTQRSHPDSGTTRWRPAVEPVEADEVLVEGPRVIAPGGRAVLAVDETLRYGPLKAGYHGGAAPAEVVVPVVLLVPAAETVWAPAVPHEPVWWLGPVAGQEPVPVAEPETPSAQPALLVDSSPAQADRWTGRLFASDAYKRQPKLRRAVTDTQVAALIDALQDAPNHRIARELAARSLGIPVQSVDGALAQVMQLLNVDGYPVLAVDPGTREVVLDEQLLVEQFGLAP